MIFGEFNFAAQGSILCGLAPEGRDVYTVTSLLLRHELRGIEIALTIPLTLRSRSCQGGFGVNSRSYKHLAPLEQKPIYGCNFKVEFSFPCEPFHSFLAR